MLASTDPSAVCVAFSYCFLFLMSHKKGSAFGRNASHMYYVGWCRTHTCACVNIFETWTWVPGSLARIFEANNCAHTGIALFPIFKPRRFFRLFLFPGCNHIKVHTAEATDLFIGSIRKLIFGWCGCAMLVLMRWHSMHIFEPGQWKWFAITAFMRQSRRFFLK